MTVLEAKIKYNELLKRHMDSIEFINNPEKAEQVDKKQGKKAGETYSQWYQAFEAIMTELSQLLNIITIYTNEEATQGFKI